MFGFGFIAVPGELQFGAICAISGFFQATFCKIPESGRGFRVLTGLAGETIFPGRLVYGFS